MPLAASPLDLPKNILHFSPPPPYSMEFSRQGSSIQEEEGEPSFIFSALKAMPSVQGRTLIASPSRKTASSPSKLETFFETLVNLPSSSEGSDNALKNRPRLIYIRDFPTLAPSSSIWYPPLLAAVRNRRKGPISRPSSVVASPMTIIFGTSPPITPPKSSLGSTSYLMSRNASSSETAQGGKPENLDDWNESETAELAREERLNKKVKKWDKDSDTILDEVPRLSTKQKSGDSPLKPEIVFIGGPSNVSPLLGMPVRFGIWDPDGDTNSQFFRFSVVLPKTHPLPQLRDTRINRRREINELIVRMELGAAGGVLESMPAELAFKNIAPASENSPSNPLKKMWEEWGNEIETWSNVRSISDRAMGSVMALHHLSGERATLDSIVVPWTAVQAAWESSQKAVEDIAPDEQEDPSKAELDNDKVIEGVKNDSDLDSHEQRLISCIVDPSTSSH